MGLFDIFKNKKSVTAAPVTGWPVPSEISDDRLFHLLENSLQSSKEKALFLIGFSAFHGHVLSLLIRAHKADGKPFERDSAARFFINSHNERTTNSIEDEIGRRRHFIIIFRRSYSMRTLDLGATRRSAID